MKTLALLSAILLAPLVGAVAAVAWALHRAGELPADHPVSFLAGPRANNTVVVCCGDSLTHGHIGYDWIAALRGRLPGHTFVNAGINGELAWNLAQRLEQIITCRPDLLTLLIGSNDAMGAGTEQLGRDYMRDKQLPQPPSLQWYETELRDIVDRLQRETDARLVMITLPPIGEQADAAIQHTVTDYNAVIYAIAEEHDLQVLPLGEHLTAILDREGRSDIPYRIDGARRARIARAIIMRYLFRWSWSRIGEHYGLRTQCDFIHLNERSGSVLEELVYQAIRPDEQPLKDCPPCAAATTVRRDRE